MNTEKTDAIQLAGEEIFVGRMFVLGEITYSEDEIIAFAERNDPLWLHIDKDRAKKGPWGGIIASGPMLLIEFHKRFWVPKFGDTVIAGKGIQNWNYYKPHRPDMAVHCDLEVKEIVLKPERRQADIRWGYNFYDNKHEKVQTCEYLVVHFLGGKVVE